MRQKLIEINYTVVVDIDAHDSDRVWKNEFERSNWYSYEAKPCLGKGVEVSFLLPNSKNGKSSVL